MDTLSPSDELLDLASDLGEQAEKYRTISQALEKLTTTAQEIGKSWSGSCLGYHSRVYYRNFECPLPGHRFSQEWGLMNVYANDGSSAHWAEQPFDAVVQHITQIAGSPDFKFVKKVSDEAREEFEEVRSETLSILSQACVSNPQDLFLTRFITEIENLAIIGESDFVSAQIPKGQFLTRDSVALGGGTMVSPHGAVIAKVHALTHPFIVCEKLVKVIRRAGIHLSRVSNRHTKTERIGTKVFIGHGRSKIWKDLKDFLQDRLSLSWDEFNRVPVAGVTNIARLSQMLDDAAVAFLILTAEDELADGKIQARMNVIHEAGLFQGRLGFHRAILLLEEGCEEFSNVQGLGQIRFPKDDISAVFEEIRRVLEREELVED